MRTDFKQSGCLSHVHATASKLEELITLLLVVYTAGSRRWEPFLLWPPTV